MPKRSKGGHKPHTLAWYKRHPITRHDKMYSRKFIRNYIKRTLSGTTYG